MDSEDGCSLPLQLFDESKTIFGTLLRASTTSSRNRSNDEDEEVVRIRGGNRSDSDSSMVMPTVAVAVAVSPNRTVTYLLRKKICMQGIYSGNFHVGLPSEY